jgi:hypothetical protein
MTKSSALKQLDTIIGKLSHLNYHIQGNTLQSAIRDTAYARNLLQSSQVKIRKV